MPVTTTQAQNHEPMGDPEHVAYGKDYYWTCTCGQSGRFLTSQSKAENQAEQHERYCDGTATVEVSIL